jgi:GntR family transcriptional regulator, transcriptional repressor for pyruvate dehydrogenase complex
MDAQRAIEGAAAELAARQATPQDHARLAQLVDQAGSLLDNADAFTRSSRDFHLGVAAASHNRVLVCQLVSLAQVSWPRRNRTPSRDVVQRVLETHRDLVRLIAAREPAAARALMDDHVKMIRARRVGEHAEEQDTDARLLLRTRNRRRSWRDSS